MDSTNAATTDPLHSLPFLVKLASETWINVPTHQLLREKKWYYLAHLTMACAGLAQLNKSINSCKAQMGISQCTTAYMTSVKLQIELPW